ncbi:hypothetical protein INT44_007599 [Umbelopsis vinacea]|uniref:Uncharacterized protein n=1 Tax=Umbelopsis vinacea TaxID=44442 RepID=A0A8H7PJL7_9FUNG|nr:hypothetical protein INT44_007599 [Umbelopsis vinacea]
MDVGNLKQPYGKSTEKHPLGKGLFKVGDYDDDQVPSSAAPKSHGSFTETLKSGYDKVTGKNHNKEGAGTATTNTASATASAPAAAPQK